MNMRTTFATGLLLLSRLASGSSSGVATSTTTTPLPTTTTSPTAPTSTLPTAVDCDMWIAASDGDTCQSFAQMWKISLSTFEALNPDVTCPGVLVGSQSYCTVGKFVTASVMPSKTTGFSSSYSTPVLPSSTAASEAQPLVSTDGTCGAASGNTTCVDAAASTSNAAQHGPLMSTATVALLVTVMALPMHAAGRLLFASGTV